MRGMSRTINGWIHQKTEILVTPQRRAETMANGGQVPTSLMSLSQGQPGKVAKELARCSSSRTGKPALLALVRQAQGNPESLSF